MRQKPKHKLEKSIEPKEAKEKEKKKEIEKKYKSSRKHITKWK